jgi:hypothetical protein
LIEGDKVGAVSAISRIDPDLPELGASCSEALVIISDEGTNQLRRGAVDEDLQLQWLGRPCARRVLDKEQDAERPH